MTADLPSGQRTARLRVLVITSSPFLAGAWTGALATRGHSAVAYLTSPGPPRRRLEGYAEVAQNFGPTADVIISSHPSKWAQVFAPYELDLIVCCGFPWRLPPALLGLPRLGAINAHPSLLPKYRGAGPNVFGWMFRNDERETGVTVHRMAAEFDTGAILAQERIPIEDDDNVAAVTARLAEPFMRVLDLGIAKAEAGDPGVPQLGPGFYCEAFEEEWRQVDWSRPARSVHNQVRSWTGMESQGHSIAMLGGDKITVRRTRLVAISSPDSNGERPGTVLRRDADGILVQCGDGPLLIVDWT